MKYLSIAIVSLILSGCEVCENHDGTHGITSYGTYSKSPHGNSTFKVECVDGHVEYINGDSVK